jgi:hypothetical protein
LKNEKGQIIFRVGSPKSGQSDPLADIVRSDMGTENRGEFADIGSIKRSTADLKMLAAQLAELSSATNDGQRISKAIPGPAPTVDAPDTIEEAPSLS